ncbi:ABC transporter permease subunit [Paenibacillus monticola]|uniref:ABC transporter permease subunit n=1 Tax=Paenibacillus monticola TaxID=2666075 RepID=A0A7X2H9K2_9BACL|nr:ABC transporter permease subunit [Paenibacillus monticola]MRN56072.1 ABC transporter permease subunit [Paenibacillus monticola]
MNMALLRNMAKVHGKTLASYISATVLYELLIIWVYPSIANSPQLNDLLTSMPAGLMKALGVEGGIQKYNDYLSAQFYGTLFVVILMVYCIMTSVQAIARLVDRGSMAYLLSTPVSRSKVAVTQAIVLVFGLFAFSICTTIGGLLGAQFLIDAPAYDKGLFVQVNLIVFLLFTFIASYCFLISCLCDDEKRALSWSSSLTVLFYSLDLVGKMSSNLTWMRYLSPFYLFRPQDIVKGTFPVGWVSLGLGIGALLIFWLSVSVFRRRDLPL